MTTELSRSVSSAEPENTGRDKTGRWVKGTSGSPHGRPPSARQKLSEAFLKAMSAEFERNGPDAIQRACAADPVRFMQVVASLVPKELGLTGADGGPIQGELRVVFVRPGEDVERHR